VTCPWCGSPDVEQVRDFGSLLMTSQWFCEDCGSPFERIKQRGSDAGPRT
jgi:transposase-like protein